MNVDMVYVGFCVVSLGMFRVFRPAVAVLIVFLGGWLLLPVGHYPAGAADAKFPYWITGLAVPSDMLLTKAWVAPVAALLGVAAFDHRALLRGRPNWADAPIALWCVWPSIAAFFVADASPSGVVASLYLLGCWGVPWLLGRLCFSTSGEQRLLVRGLVISAIVCLPFSLLEGALGPQVYGWVYERHPFRLDGAIRYLGFRPLGFFEDGNQFGLWVSLCALAAIWLARNSAPHTRRVAIGIAVLVVAMALAAQSLGAIALLLGGAVFLWACGRIRPRWMAAGVVALLFIGGATYVSGVLPITAIAKETAVGRQVVDGFRTIGRGSFTWRISQDQKLLSAAMAHPVTGTSTWDWWRDRDTRPWGLSLLVVGQFGLTGLVLLLATLLGPALRVAWQAPRASGWQPQALPLMLATIVLLAVLDALLNAFIFFPAVLMAGALARSTGDRQG